MHTNVAGKRPLFHWCVDTTRLNWGGMADIVNLRRARKAKARTEAEAEAQANRVQHGRSKAERNLTEAQYDVADRKLDAHKRGTADQND